MATQRLQKANSKRQKEEVWPGNSCTWSCHKSFLTSSSSPYSPLKLPFGEYLFTSMYFNLTLLTYNSGSIRSHTRSPMPGSRHICAELPGTIPQATPQNQRAKEMPLLLQSRGRGLRKLLSFHNHPTSSSTRELSKHKVARKSRRPTPCLCQDLSQHNGNFYFLSSHPTQFWIKASKNSSAWPTLSHTWSCLGPS